MYIHTYLHQQISPILDGVIPDSVSLTSPACKLKVLLVIKLPRLIVKLSSSSFCSCMLCNIPSDEDGEELGSEGLHTHTHTHTVLVWGGAQINH